MSNLSDKDLDRLSREAAELYEPDTSSLSWSRLEQKLMKQMPERPPDGFRFGRIHPYLWGPAVVLLAGISFYFIKNNFYSLHSTPTNQPTNQTIPVSPTGSKPSQGNTNLVDSISSAAGLVATDNRKGKKSKPEADNAENNSGSDNPHASSEKLVTGVSKETTVNKYSGKKSTQSTASLVAAGSLASAGSILSNGANTTIHSNESEITYESASGPLSHLGNHGVVQKNYGRYGLPLIVKANTNPGHVKGNDSLLNKFAQSKTPTPNKSLRVNQSLNFGMAFGPDYTDAGGGSNNQIGNNIGFTIGYYLTSRLSVNTGILYSNKFYWSPGKKYNQSQITGPPNSYANRTYAAAPSIEFVNGSCNMWELPLTLRYDFIHSKKTKFFANAGLSSYFMMKQSYIYFFHNGIYPRAWEKTDNEQVNYWFGVADLSFGLETEIGKGFSFQVEPYMKFPLKKMGSENLKLNSYGVLLSFRYTPVLSRTRK